MGRPHRPDIAGAWYHVINRGAGRATIFFDDRDRVEFERLLGVVHERFGVVVHSYCWMTNHYHLLVECPHGGLSDAMHHLGSRYVRHVNDRLDRDGPLFRDRFTAKRVTSDAYLLRLVRYINRNPVAIVGSEKLVAFRWSSLRILLGHRRVPRWMRTDVVVEMCGGRSALESLVLAAEAPGHGEVDGAAIMDAIDLLVDEHGEDQRVGRVVAVAVLDRLDRQRGAEFSSQLDFPTPAAARAARSRARRRLEERPELSLVVDAVLRMVA